MNKGDLIDTLSSELGITKVLANEAIDCLTDNIIKALKGGDKVTLVGFGTFSVLERAARNGHNPQTGKTIKIKAKKVPKFKAGKEFAMKIASKRK
jgi:DNA-binding protein HU-beta